MLSRKTSAGINSRSLLIFALIILVFVLVAMQFSVIRPSIESTQNQGSQFESSNGGNSHPTFLNQGSQVGRSSEKAIVSKVWSDSKATNYLAPDLQLHHHPIYSHFDPYEGPFDPENLIDFLGLKTKWRFDCQGSGGYRAFYVSRREPCIEFEKMKERYEQTGPFNYKSSFPTIDEEYFELIDALTAAYKTNTKFVAVELGARYGPWISKAVAAFRKLHPDLPYECVGVEAEPQTFEWMKYHLDLNNIKCKLLNNFVSDQAGKEMDIQYESPTKSKVLSTTLKEILEPLDHVDYMDLDIQGAESFCVEPFMDILNAKVKHIHFGVHSPLFDPQIEQMFLKNGWKQIWKFPTGDLAKCDPLDHTKETTCHTQTPYGPVVFRDGVQSYYNPRLVGDMY